MVAYGESVGPSSFYFLILCAGVVTSVAVRRRHRRLIAFGLVASVVVPAALSATLGPPPWDVALLIILWFAIFWCTGVTVGLLVREVFARWVASRQAF
jgi:hypothetical protein